MKRRLMGVTGVLLLAGVGACSFPATEGGGNGGASARSLSSTGSGGGNGGATVSAGSGGTSWGSGGSTTATGTGGEGIGSGGAAPTGTGGGPTDAGTSAGGAGARIDAGGSTTSCPGLFCEDFEKGVIDPAVWDIKLNGGQAAPNLVTQAGLVAHGKYAAHFRANPNVTSYDFIITKAPPAGLGGHHFGRAYFMVTPMPPANHTQYLFSGTTGFPQHRYLEVASAAPLVWQLTYVDLMPPTTGEDYHSGGKVPVGKWMCLEWEFNDTPDSAAVYVDGALSYSRSAFTFGGSSTGLVGGFAAFGFGYWAWHPASYAFDVYYDDIVLDTKRIGCL